MISWLILITGAYPLWVAWCANRRTSLLHAVQWGLVAWAAWGAALAASAWAGSNEIAARYVALSLTGCSGIAVLGARRPGVTAWNFVVAGLVVVLLLPLLEGMDRLGPLRLLFLGAVLMVGLLNYLPTRLSVAVLFLGVGCAVEVLSLVGVEKDFQPSTDAIAIGRCLLALSPWMALILSRRKRRVRSEFDLVWLTFRDRFGLFWAQRLREQFNCSAANAGWPVQLRWRGLRRVNESVTGQSSLEEQEEMVATLRALLKRFGPEEKPSTSHVNKHE